jgi:hypothetical protein
MRHVRVPHPSRNPLQPVRHTKIERLNPSTPTTNHVMMMMLTGIELVPINPVPKIAPPHQIQLLKRRQGAVNRHQIPPFTPDSPMDLFRTERTVARHQKIQKCPTLIRHA